MSAQTNLDYRSRGTDESAASGPGVIDDAMEIERAFASPVSDRRLMALCAALGVMSSSLLLAGWGVRGNLVEAGPFEAPASEYEHASTLLSGQHSADVPPAQDPLLSRSARADASLIEVDVLARSAQELEARINALRSSRAAAIARTRSEIASYLSMANASDAEAHPGRPHMSREFCLERIAALRVELEQSRTEADTELSALEQELERIHLARSKVQAAAAD